MRIEVINLPLTKDVIDVLTENNNWECYVEIAEEDISFAVSKTQRQAINPFIEKRIESIWIQKSKKIKAQGRALTSNPIFGIQSIEKTGNKYILNIYESTYKYVIATRNFQIPRYHKYFLGVRGICFFEISEAKYIILGERNKEMTCMGGDFEPVPGGLLEPDDLKSDNSIRTALLRELHEEIPPTKEKDISEIKVVSLKKNRQYVSVDIRFLIELNKKWQENYEIHQKTDYVEIQPLEGKFPEHKNIIGVPVNYLSKFILTYKDRLAHSKDVFLDLHSKKCL